MEKLKVEVGDEGVFMTSEVGVMVDEAFFYFFLVFFSSPSLHCVLVF